MDRGEPLPSPYYIDESDPDVVTLHREDGSLVAAFNLHSATEADLRIAARRDEQRRTAVDQKSP
jgi:hypothetical protein